MESNRRPSPYHGHPRLRATSSYVGRSAAHLPIPGPGGSGIASDSLTVVTTISHHYGLPSSLRPPGAAAAKTDPAAT